MNAACLNVSESDTDYKKIHKAPTSPPPSPPHPPNLRFGPFYESSGQRFQTANKDGAALSAALRVAMKIKTGIDAA